MSSQVQALRASSNGCCSLDNIYENGVGNYMKFENWMADIRPYENRLIAKFAADQAKELRNGTISKEKFQLWYQFNYINN